MFRLFFPPLPRSLPHNMLTSATTRARAPALPARSTATRKAVRAAALPNNKVRSERRNGQLQRRASRERRGWPLLFGGAGRRGTGCRRRCSGALSTLRPLIYTATGERRPRSHRKAAWSTAPFPHQFPSHRSLLSSPLLSLRPPPIWPSPPAWPPRWPRPPPRWRRTPCPRPQPRRPPRLPALPWPSRPRPRHP